MTVLILAFVICTSTAHAADAPSVLEISVNGHEHRGIAVVLMRDNTMLVQPEDLAAAGIKLKPEETGTGGMVAIDKIPGLSAHIIPTEQKLDITAIEARLMPQLFDLRPAGNFTPGESTSGFLGHYDLSGSVNDVEHPDNTSSLARRCWRHLFHSLRHHHCDGICRNR